MNIVARCSLPKSPTWNCVHYEISYQANDPNELVSEAASIPARTRRDTSDLAGPTGADVEIWRRQSNFYMLPRRRWAGGASSAKFAEICDSPRSAILNQ
jgi:hypothetical protein